MTALGLNAPRIRKAAKSARHLVAELWYERRYGVRTSGNLVLQGHDTENVGYTPMNWRDLRRALPRRSVTNRDVFLDIGSGKGRAVLMAAVDYPFGRVVGVELVRELHVEAERNMAAAGQRVGSTVVQLVCTDMRQYQIPDDVTVIYMNNPVRGSIFAAVLTAISESMIRSPRPMRLIYHNPAEEDALLATGQWRKARTIMSRRRRANWPFGATCVYEWSAGGGSRG
jgi:SAM-dependent methyltransferase